MYVPSPSGTPPKPPKRYSSPFKLIRRWPQRYFGTGRDESRMETGYQLFSFCILNSKIENLKRRSISSYYWKINHSNFIIIIVYLLSFACASSCWGHFAVLADCELCLCEAANCGAVIQEEMQTMTHGGLIFRVKSPQSLPPSGKYSSRLTIFFHYWTVAFALLLIFGGWTLWLSPIYVLSYFLFSLCFMNAAGGWSQQLRAVFEEFYYGLYVKSFIDQSWLKR
jgi:hypothetical protein